jgi:uncharacterized membrane protein
MTKLLLRTFIKNHQNTDDPGVRMQYGRLAGFVGILCNVFLFAAKLIVGSLSGSVSITADAVNNLSDASSSIVTLLGFKLAEKPADAGHPFGHARIEYLSGLIVAASILVIGFELAKTSIGKILHPQDVTFSAALVIVLSLSILVKLWMMFFNRSLGKRIHSTTLDRHLRRQPQRRHHDLGRPGRLPRRPPGPTCKHRRLHGPRSWRSLSYTAAWHRQGHDRSPAR